MPGSQRLPPIYPLALKKKPVYTKYMIRIAINGYGRIGRVAHRVITQWHSQDLEIVGINAGSSTDINGWMYLLKYDSVYGLFPYEVSVKPNTDPNKKDFLGHLVVEEKEIPVYSQKDATQLPWKDLNVDVVIESTGAFTTAEKLQAHIASGAKGVVLSAPAKGDGVPTYVISVNDTDFKGGNMISNASCTTNCITPVAKIIQQHFGVDKAMMTTVHGYTSDQRLQDGGHKDYRRARAAGLSIIPTSTGATIAAAETLPELKGIFGGLSLRVPVPVGSLSDFTFLLKKNVTKEEVNAVLTQESEKPEYKGVLAVTTDPLVSSDIIGNSHSSIVDLSLTQVVGGNMLKVIAWYDNEYGYANRLVEEAIMIGQHAAGENHDEPSIPQPVEQPSNPVAPGEPNPVPTPPPPPPFVPNPPAPQPPVPPMQPNQPNPGTPPGSVVPPAPQPQMPDVPPSAPVQPDTQTQ